MLPVLIELDGVIADLRSVWVERYNREWNDTLTVDQITSWDIGDFVRPEARQWMFDVLADEKLYDTVEPVPHAIEGLMALDELEVPWVIATSCAYLGMVKAKAHWMLMNGLSPMPRIWDSGGPYPADRMIVVRDKGLLRGSLLVDDHPKNLRAFQGPPVCFDAPYNRHDWDGPRVTSWVELVPYILVTLQEEAWNQAAAGR